MSGDWGECVYVYDVYQDIIIKTNNDIFIQDNSDYTFKVAIQNDRDIQINFNLNDSDKIQVALLPEDSLLNDIIKKLLIALVKKDWCNIKKRVTYWDRWSLFDNKQDEYVPYQQWNSINVFKAIDDLKKDQLCQ